MDSKVGGTAKSINDSKPQYSILKTIEVSMLQFIMGLRVVRYI